MKIKPKLLCLDRDGLINQNSSDKDSPHYYILKSADLILLPGVQEAFHYIKTWEIPVVLWTKQKCIKKGLATKEQIAQVNKHLETLLDFKFAGVYVDVENLKLEALGAILSEYKHIPFEDILVIDDTIENLSLPEVLGIQVKHTTNLLEAINE